MHSALVFKLFSDPDADLLQTHDTEEWHNARSLIVDLILETDMTRHFELHGKFRAYFMSKYDSMRFHT
jgi:hypothetical protein